MTCGARDLSPEWDEQLAPNGVILYPFSILALGDPTLLVGRSGQGFHGKFTRLIYFVPLQSELLACSVQPDGIGEAAATALGEGEEELHAPDFLPEGLLRERNKGSSFTLYWAHNLRDGESLVVNERSGIVGIADHAARTACFLCVVDDQLKMKVVGGTRSLERLREIYEEWHGLGSPPLQDYDITVAPVSQTCPALARGFTFVRKHYRYIFSTGGEAC